ncbi:hypothetical protein HRbin22_02207 [Candidatus Thermoflexus japonica]|uniref:Uncharacterized protein n=1 Tax=Candidatus Thermoflexus japonica TaxID=2035417 RepID=A0A2H5Y914_9CHLR|nr:hypothetical protein HRbin22_02207 [Candidatus Thermoflexus japonica]
MEGRLRPAGIHHYLGLIKKQTGGLLEACERQSPEPSAQRLQAPGGVNAPHRPLHGLHRGLQVPGLQEVGDGGLGVAAPGEPVPRLPVQEPVALRIPLPQVEVEELPEEMMIAIPWPLGGGLHLDQEELAPVRLLDPLGGIGAAPDGVAGGDVEEGEDRRLQEERLELRGLAGEDFLLQVAIEGPRLAGPEGRSGSRLAEALGQQQDGGDPPFGLLGQGLGLGLGELHGVVAGEEGVHLLGGEGEVLGAQTDRLLAGHQAGQRQAVGAAAGQHDVEVFRRVLQEMPDHDLDPRMLGHHVVIVQDQDEVVGDVLEHVVDHSGGHGIGRGPGPQDAQGDAAEGGEPLAEGGDHVLHEAVGVLVRLIQAIPGDGQVRVVVELDEERRLPVAGGRGDQDEGFIDVLVEEVQQAGTIQQRPAPHRRVDLRSGDRELGDHHAPRVNHARPGIQGPGAGSLLPNAPTRSARLARDSGSLWLERR